MNVENLIKEEARHLKNSRRTIEIAPDISENHINTIKKKYGATLRESIAKQILVMSYTGTGFFFFNW